MDLEQEWLWYLKKYKWLKNARLDLSALAKRSIVTFYQFSEKVKTLYLDLKSTETNLNFVCGTSENCCILFQVGMKLFFYFSFAVAASFLISSAKKWQPTTFLLFSRLKQIVVHGFCFFLLRFSKKRTSWEESSSQKDDLSQFYFCSQKWAIRHSRPKVTSQVSGQLIEFETHRLHVD